IVVVRDIVAVVVVDGLNGRRVLEPGAEDRPSGCRPGVSGGPAGRVPCARMRGVPVVAVDAPIVVVTLHHASSEIAIGRRHAAESRGHSMRSDRHATPRAVPSGGAHSFARYGPAIWTYGHAAAGFIPARTFDGRSGRVSAARALTGPTID